MDASCGATGASHLTIGVDLAGILRGTYGEHPMWVGAEWGEVWEGRPFSSQLGGLGERYELPQQSPDQKRILAYWPQNAPFCTYLT